MPVLTGNKKPAKHIKLRKPRKCQLNKHITEATAPTHHPIPYKSTISSLLLSTLSPNNNEPTPTKKMGCPTFSSGRFRALGCKDAALAETVSVPAMIRSSADWDVKKMGGTSFSSGRFGVLGCKAANVAETVSVPVMIRSSADWDVKKSGTKKKKGCENKRGGQGMWIDCSGCGNSGSCAAAAAVVPDVWCGPGIGFSAADDAVPMDCLVARSNVGGRVKIDVEKMRHRERASCPVRRTVSPEAFSSIDSDTALFTTHPEPELFGTTSYCRHARPPSPDGFAEIMLLQDSFISGERFNMPDRHRGWRLDVDNMTYEELLELGEQIGHVNTGLKEDEISRLLRKFKLLSLYDLSSQLPMQLDRKCSICQDEYEVEDEIGKLNCGHGYHIQCIKQWLLQKNACPVCKTAPVAR